MWVGNGVQRRHLGDRILGLAERMRMPVVESVMGKGSVDESNPLVLGVYSGAGSAQALGRFVEDSDLVIEMGIDINDISTGAFSTHIAEARSANSYHGVTRVQHRTYEGVGLEPLTSALEGMPLPSRALPAEMPHGWVDSVS